jgi:hypothetical protein
MTTRLAVAAAKRLAEERTLLRTGPLATAQKALWEALLRGGIDEALRPVSSRALNKLETLINSEASLRHGPGAPAARLPTVAPDVRVELSFTPSAGPASPSRCPRRNSFPSSRRVPAESKMTCA